MIDMLRQLVPIRTVRVRPRPFALGVVLVLLQVAATSAAADKSARYSAMLANGRRIEGASLADWHATTPPPTPKLDGQPLLDPSQPLRWLRDRAVVYAAPPVAFLETTTGDRLPGVVLGFDDGSQAPFDPRGAHFVVRPEFPLNPPTPIPEPKIRVLAAYVRRIVWQRRPGPSLPPGVALLRDGRQQAFRAARFSTEGVNLLTEQGPRRVLYGELAEIALPAANPWDALLDELAVLAPTGVGRLLQFETIDGLVATSSLERLRCHPFGAPQDSARWLHGIQPVWSLDMLWLLNPRIAVRRLWSPDEMPLSRLAPTVSRHQALVGASGQTARLNRNVLDGPLHSGGLDFGWGYGVQSLSQLEFELPTLASAFRSHVGLDRTTGAGGCVRARAYLAGLDKPPAYDSGYLVGSGVVSETGVIPLPSGGAVPSRLILEIDPAHDGRPAGADPLDIRDQADWLDPLVMLDAGKLAGELARRARGQLAPWAGWTVWLDATPAAADQRGTLEWSTSWNDLAAAPGALQVGVAARNRPLVLRKSLTVGPRDRWFVAAASQAVASNPPVKIEVRIEGDLVAEQPVALRNAGQRDPPPLLVNLEPYRGRVVEVEVVQSASPGAMPNTPPQVVHWRTLGAFEQLPTLYRIFDDEADVKLTPVAEGGPEGGVASVTAEGAMIGPRALRLTPAGLFRLELRAPAAIRETPGWGEYRYVRFAVRKQGDGRFAMQFETVEPREKPARLDGGQGVPALEGAVRIYQAKLPDQWIALPHDLFGAYGKLDLSGLTLSAVDGGAAMFDAIYLGRTLADFEMIGRDREFPLPDRPTLDALSAVATARAKVGLVTLESSDGRRALGTLLTADGDVLTTARFAHRPQLPVKIRLPDGKFVNAQTRGVAREYDVALVKITDPGPFTPVEIDPQLALPLDRPYAVATREFHDKPSEPTLSPTMLRRVARGSAWIAQTVEKLPAGSPLFDANGRVIGWASHLHGDRWSFARSFDVAPLLPRLRNGEVIGAWPISLAPSLGAVWKTHAAGAQIDQLAANSPAQAAGLKPGDVVVRIDGQPVGDPRGVAEILTSKDFGQEIGVDLQDGRSLRVKLTP